MHVTGHCHCGAIRFEADVDPASARACHCTDCQILGGTAFTTNVVVNTGTFKLLSGAPATYIKTAESGNKRAHGFCPTCATRLYSASVNKEPTDYALRIGTLDQRADLPPKREIWCRSALPWTKDVDGAVRSGKQ
ncbi:MAG: GFA family protein [Rhodospirillaceae bacterium]|nr:GFA family protein [Rhodospirillaceae bacterium]